MALQYDKPVTSTEFAASLAANTSISTTTTAAISSVLGLDSTDSLVVAGWNGVDPVTAPVGQIPDVLAISAADEAVLSLPAGTENTAVVILDTQAGDDVTLTIGAEAAASARLLATDAVVEGIARVVVGGDGNETITVNGSANVLLDGGAGDDTLTTGSGNDVIIAGTGTNTIDAGAGNDTIVTGLGVDTIEAGAGFDTIDVVGNRADFAATVADGALVLTGAGASAGAVSTVTGAEFVSFADGKSLAIVETQAEAQALSLYQALLGRDADAGGAQNFLSAVDSGTSLTAVADQFLNSNEYLTAERTDFLGDLYQGLFGRATDTTGLEGWLSVFEQGASRSDVIAGIAGSAEASALSNDAFVSALYEAALGRASGGTEADGWLSLLESGTSRTEVADSIFASAESNTKSNSEFVDSLFDNLGNTDAAAKAGYVLALDNGATHNEVVVTLIGQTDVDSFTNVIVVPGAV